MTREDKRSKMRDARRREMQNDARCKITTGVSITPVLLKRKI